ncbi:MAG: hypothetical protein A3H44_02090 [Gammaproteobacteria bacterium RIFCSPLOWO2_02_FULL_57_10]|nr:MAG: hypothetical protein A3H44_02090 [Gammaproteobacteria bacterium RIFCSPLOWO2_02_FULL_57_10]
MTRTVARKSQGLRLLMAAAVFVLFQPSIVSAQNTAVPLDFDPQTFLNDLDEAGEGAPAEFTWVRGRYTNYGGGRNRRGGGGFGGGGFGGRGGWWDTDFPDAESNFLRGVQRYTNIDTNSKSYDWLDLTDPRLYEHTFLYMNMKRVPIGSIYSGPNFSAEEIEALREFMFRGGFVLLDDFWGDAHLEDFQMEMAKLFTERELVKLDTRHELFHTFFDVEEVVQVPGRAVTWDFNGGFSLDDPSYPPAVYAILDDDGRVMLVANFNADLGDGWEHTFYEPYPTHYSNEAYKIAINYLIYAFTH